MKYNLYGSKFFKLFDYVARLVIINLLIVIPSFLIFILMSIFFKDIMETNWSILTLLPAVLYLFPSICAGVDLVCKYELKLTNTIFKEFFKSLKKVYLKALLETFFIVIIIFLMYNSISYFSSNLNEIINIFGFFLSIAFSAFLGFIVLHIPLVMSYMPGLFFIEDIKLATLMAFKDFYQTLLVLIATVIIIYLSIIYDTILIIGGVSLPIYILVKFTFKKYYIVYLRHKDD